MPYIRCDKDCKPATGQLSEAGVPINQPTEVVVEQKLSCIEYEVFNGDYLRARTGIDQDFPPLVQPDLKSGWNGDYVKLDVDNNPAVQPITGESKVDASMYMVTQNKPDSNPWYVKRDIDNEPAVLKCYVRRDVDNELFEAEVDPDSGAIQIGEELAILALQDDRDNIFITENDIFRIELEANTVLDKIVHDNVMDNMHIQTVLDEQGKRLVYEDGILIRVEELE